MGFMCRLLTSAFPFQPRVNRLDYMSQIVHLTATKKPFIVNITNISIVISATVSGGRGENGKSVLKNVRARDTA